MTALKNAAVSVAAAAMLASVAATPSFSQDAGVEIGQLNCEVAGGAGFVFGSSKDLTCTLKHLDDSIPQETYTGKIKKFGIDIGVTGKTVILWTVVAAKEDVYKPGALAGTYTGGSAEASFAVGLGANALVGGNENSFALQPLSVSAGTGVNVAVGLAQITLQQVN